MSPASELWPCCSPIPLPSAHGHPLYALLHHARRLPIVILTEHERRRSESESKDLCISLNIPIATPFRYRPEQAACTCRKRVRRSAVRASLYKGPAPPPRMVGFHQ